ncbi:hypothetical protein C7M84_011620 [Penaeus vannamei]|uniref:Uncharacterized protein n=1 Tax=Penaeus vannamei TaxID=6689 RepID=A0A3R7PFJ8_PENVA|nr:hypothetical protein C7M84_011620 [Penaeus vannamei]
MATIIHHSHRLPTSHHLPPPSRYHQTHITLTISTIPSSYPFVLNAHFRTAPPESAWRRRGAVLRAGLPPLPLHAPEPAPAATLRSRNDITRNHTRPLPPILSNPLLHFSPLYSLYPSTHSPPLSLSSIPLYLLPNAFPPPFFSTPFLHLSPSPIPSLPFFTSPLPIPSPSPLPFPYSPLPFFFTSPHPQFPIPLSFTSPYSSIPSSHSSQPSLHPPLPLSTAHTSEGCVVDQGLRLPIVEIRFCTFKPPGFWLPSSPSSPPQLLPLSSPHPPPPSPLPFPIPLIPFPYSPPCPLHPLTPARLSRVGHVAASLVAAAFETSAVVTIATNGKDMDLEKSKCPTCFISSVRHRLTGVSWELGCGGDEGAPGARGPGGQVDPRGNRGKWAFVRARRQSKDCPFSFPDATRS